MDSRREILPYVQYVKAEVYAIFGSGTQKLEAEVHKLFPTASTIRMDIDTVSK